VIVIQKVDLKGISQPTGPELENPYIYLYFGRTDFPDESYSMQMPSAYALKIHRWTAKHTKFKPKM
jgi:hypothetical protein